MNGDIVMKHPIDIASKNAIENIIKHSEKETFKYIIFSFLLISYIGYTIPDTPKSLIITIPLCIFTIFASLANFSHAGVLRKELSKANYY